MTTDDTRARALEFLKSHRTGVLATVSRSGQPQASPVHYIVDDDFNVYFATQMRSRKYEALAAHPRVAFSVGEQDVPQAVQLEGSAADISTSEEARDLKVKIMEALSANPHFAGPITQLDSAAYSIIWIKPDWLRFADFAYAEKGDEHIFQQIIG